MAKENGFLPINKKEMRERGWKQADFVYVCGDAYVDHPSFGAAIITRTKTGIYRVGRQYGFHGESLYFV